MAGRKKTAETVLTNVSQGTLRGKKVILIGGIQNFVYYSFQGIPYAKPPVGLLRFRPPEPPEPWTGIRDALKEGSIAAQKHVVKGTMVGSEDCLFLNVYTSDLNPEHLKPVMFWIHGGGSHFGSGNSDTYNPDYLITKDIVIVTINYRLGALGYLMLDDTDSTSNNALRDEIAALNWVKENIDKFGGDPNNITLAGQSSGGCNVHQLILSPVAEGLFHRAICQSGNALIYSSYTTPAILQRRAITLAKVLGFESKNHQEIIDFLRSVPVENILEYHVEIFANEEKRQTSIAFPPVVGCIKHDGILPDTPEKLLKQGKFHNVPIILGCTSGEGKLVFLDFMECLSPLEVDKNFESVVPYDMAARCGTNKCKAVAQHLRKFYLGDEPISKTTFSKYLTMESDLIQIYPAYRVMCEVSKHSNSLPFYFYLFDHKKKTNKSFLSREIMELPGAAHNDELYFLFRQHSPQGMEPADVKVSSLISKLWINFIKTGNPNDKDLPIEWLPATKDNKYSLNIREEPELLKNQFEDRMKFLDDLHTACRFLKEV